MAKLPHRDSYAGIIARELAKDGTFGREEDRYGFCSWSVKDGYKISVFENEDDCAREQFRYWMLWGIVSKRIYRSARLYDNETDEGLNNSVRDYIKYELLPLLKVEVEDRLRMVNGQTELTITERLRDFSSESEIMKAGLVALAWHKGLVGDDFCSDLVIKAAEELSKPVPNVRYGFVYKDINGFNPYSNAYFPTVWDKWSATNYSSAIVPIATSNDFRPYLQKKAVDNQLLSLIDERYFSALGLC